LFFLNTYFVVWRAPPKRPHIWFPSKTRFYKLRLKTNRAENSEEPQFQFRIFRFNIFNERYNYHSKALLETEFPAKNDEVIKNAIKICSQARKFLMYSYIFLYFTEESNQLNIFEHNLKILESLVELDSWEKPSQEIELYTKWDFTHLTSNHLL
jgi:hypothetical protein